MSDLTIVAYHAIEDGRGPVCLPPDVFRSQIREFRKNGCVTLTISDAARRLASGEGFPERSLVLTFDDGYASVYRTAFPILESVGFAGNVFPVTGFLGTSNGWDPEAANGSALALLTGDELRELVSAGWEVGAHTHTHRPLTGLSEAEVADEISRPSALLEEITGVRPRAFAYPYGRYDEATRAAAAATYDVCLTIGASRVTGASRPDLLERVDAWYLQRPWQARRIHDAIGSAYLASRRAARAVRSRLVRAAP